MSVDIDDKQIKAAQTGMTTAAGEGSDSIGSWLWDLVKAWLPTIMAVLFIRTFIFEPFRIPSGSMVPTLLIGDHVVVWKFSYGIWLPFVGKELVDLGDPERGDIIVFKYPRDPSMNYIKRVVGIPGDHLRVENNRIFLNGVEQTTEKLGAFTFTDDTCEKTPERHYVENLGGVQHSILTSMGLGGPLADHEEEIVPPDHVFVMGDNRDNSQDSRDWGFVAYDQIKGKAHIIWLSWDGCAGGVGRIRTERFMENLYNPPEAAVTP